MKINRKDLWTIAYLILNIVILLVAVLNIKGSAADRIGYYEDISSGWKCVEASDDALIQYENTIPSVLCNNPAMAIKTAWAEFEVVVDGQIIFTYEDPKHVNGANYVLIPLQNKDSGQKIYIRSYSNPELLAKAVKYRSFYGDKYSVYRGIFRTNTLSVIIFSLYISGVVVIWITMFRFRNSIRNKTMLMFWYQSMFGLSFGMWIIADSDFVGFILNAPRTATYLTYFSLFMVPVCALCFIDKLYVYENRSIKIYIGGLLAIAVAAVVLKETHVFEFYESIGTILKIYTLFSIFFIFEPIWDIRVYKNKLMIKMLMGAPFLVASIVFSVISYLFWGGENYGYAVALGIFFFMLFPYVETVKLAEADTEFNRLVRDIRVEKNIDMVTGMKNRAAFEKVIENTNGDHGQVYAYIKLSNYEEIRVEEGYLKSAELIRHTSDCLISVFKNAVDYYRIEKDIFVLQMRRNSLGSIQNMLNQFEEELKGKCDMDDIPLMLQMVVEEK